jgi:hypothetical protein
MRVRPVILVLFSLMFAGTAAAQSFLGTIRGTVVDPQGAPVSGAAVLIVDENTGTPRTLDTDGQGRYEAANLRPGTYRVEVVTTNFKKFARSEVLVRASSTALVDVSLELGNVNETVTVSGEALNNITLESQAIARGLDEQQLRDLPRATRDVQSFLLLNPNVVGGSGTDIQFLGGKTYGVSYIQDGQASTNAIFGTVGNSAPGLDSVAELQVLSNSYSAEYGGLAGVIVTTKSGSSHYRGTSFYDFNGDALNALTYNQTLTGVQRGDPTTDTHDHRWGASLGGPLFGGKTFFYGNYEGSNNKSVFGGGVATVPTAAMRNGDFRGTAIVPLDPVTGQPFANQIIPSGRIDQSARKVIDFFYPLPNQGTFANGYGRFQQFVPHTRKRHVSDLRVDHATGKDTMFVRTSYQHYGPNAITFEGGNALTNLPVLNRNLDTGSVIGGWNRIISSTIVNELRVGYNYDNSRRESTFRAADVASTLGLENAPSLSPDRLGFPSFQFTAGANRPTNIADQARNVDRSIRQNAFSLSDNLTWIRGAHTLKVGGLWTRNMARDGFGFGVNFRGQYRFRGTFTGNAFTDLLLGLPFDVRDQITNRGPLEGYSNDVAGFVQDDWKVNRSLTVFLGLRYDVVGAWHENSGTLANFRPIEGGFHVVPSTDVAAKLPPGLIALGRTRLASDAGLPDTLVNSDKNNFSPRVGFAWRLGGGNRTVLRGGGGIFHPTVAVQGIRDLLATNEFRFINTRRGGTLARGFSQGTPFVDAADFGNQGIDPNLESPDIYQYNLTLERELPGDFGLRVSYIGSTMRKLLVDRDYNTLPVSTVPFDPEVPADRARLPFPQYGYYMDIVENRGSGQFHAGQFEVLRRFRNGLALNVAYTLARSDSNAPDTGNATIGPVMFDPYDIEKDRGPDPNVVKHRVVANATWDVPVGRGRKHGTDMSKWADALFGGWTVASLVQARSGQHLTPFFSGFYTTSPWNTGKPLDGLGNFFCCAWRPDQIRDPNSGGSRGAFFDQTAYALPQAGQLGNAKKGSLLGPGTWVANFAFYKDVLRQDRFRLQFSAVLDNAFNHPQFFPTYGSGFVDLTSFLIDGDPANGETGVLGAGAIGNSEGFSPGRVIRLGLRARF